MTALIIAADLLYLGGELSSMSYLTTLAKLKLWNRLKQWLLKLQNNKQPSVNSGSILYYCSE